MGRPGLRRWDQVTKDEQADIRAGDENCFEQVLAGSWTCLELRARQYLYAHQTVVIVHDPQ
jgi:hypothetical protein